MESPNSRDNLNPVDLSRQRLSPLVDQYVTTDRTLDDILGSAPEPGSPIVHALRYLLDCLSGKRFAKDAIRAAQAVPLKGSDPELLVLMLTTWAQLCCRIGKPSEADALLQRAKALVSENTHPEIRAAAMLAEGVLADTTGNKAGC